MKRILIVSALLFAVVLVSSCQKNTAGKEKNTDIPSILSYLSAMNKKTNATFGIGGNAHVRTGKADFMNLHFDGVFTGGDGKPKNIGDVTFHNKIWKSNSSFHYGDGEILDKSILGKKVSFKFNPHGTVARSYDGGGSEEDSIYVPAEVIIRSPTYYDDIERNEVAPGTTFTWEPDANNDKGIIVMIEYRPEAVGNKSFVDEGHDQIVRWGIVVEDDGQYTLEASLFDEIPAGAEVEVSIIRANYEIVETEDGYSYTVYAYNYKSGIYIYKP